jgi:hypothetical protein
MMLFNSQKTISHQGAFNTSVSAKISHGNSLGQSNIVTAVSATDVSESQQDFCHLVNNNNYGYTFSESISAINPTK